MISIAAGPGRPRSNCSICFWMAASPDEKFKAFNNHQNSLRSLELLFGAPSIVPSLLTMKLKDLKDGKLGKFPATIFSHPLHPPPISGGHHSFHVGFTRLRLAQLLVRLAQSTLKLGNGPHLAGSCVRHLFDLLVLTDIAMEITMFNS